MIQLKINGVVHELDIDAEMPLLWAIRDAVGLTGTKYGCGMAECGACTVLVDGRPVRSCVKEVRKVAGRSVTTIEGLDSAEGRAVQAAWKKLDVVQCGYCQSGQIISAAALLQKNPDPDDKAIDKAMDGNICRCATYARIREAIKLAAKEVKAGGSV
ncbi:MAG: (2Fe-2S)-binding protein [Gammaproteobacteria bacterium]|nr:MAG: (2Fe-2S)-binding protein [Gammaproteobacteria bacterium]